MQYREFNLDGLVGPTHNYAGLSHGNVASRRNRASCSSPLKAALQGLEKARKLAEMGFGQGILPPHERPSVTALRNWGFDGHSDEAVLAQAAAKAPHLLASATSASAMWTANACTMAPSCDTSDGRVHFTPANLESNLHRSIEAGFTESVLREIFNDPRKFVIHPALSGGMAMADEGAANHTRLYASPDQPGLHVFVYGRNASSTRHPAPVKFPARQTLESVQAIARLHGLREEQAVFIQQNPEAIDAGVFHNDVISVGTGNTFLCHEAAFAGEQSDLDQIRQAYKALTRQDLCLIAVPADALPVEEAVRTYLFNSQLMATQNRRMLLVAPAECRESPSVSRLLDSWIADPDNPVDKVLTFDLRESMRNGGGPACLRQRVLLNESEIAGTRGRVLLDEPLYRDLVDWVKRWYREELFPEDLADPHLLRESRLALDELTQILELPDLYPFQGSRA